MRRSFEPVTDLFVSVGALLLVVTCAGTGGLVLREPRHLSGKEAQRAAPTAATPDSSPGGGGSGPSGRAPPAQPRLGRFQRALGRLVRGEAERHVRVLWLGDSHTAADFWPDAVRRRLGERFGFGGPGFLRLGMAPYRHGGVRVERAGKWRHEPPSPASPGSAGDGVVGLGGMWAVPLSADARVTVELERGALRDRAHWELVFRLPRPGARFRVAVDGAPSRMVGDDHPWGSGLQRLTLEGRPEGRLELAGFVGEPELFGVTVESGSPGIVIDTVGIDGARVATLLGWNEQSWVDEVRRRSPVLAVVALGTNEVVSPQPVELMPREIAELVARLRRASSELDCLLIGPTPVEQPDGTTHPRVAAIDLIEQSVAESLGCAYFSVYRAMGEEGGYARWSSERPSLTAHDQVHLSAAGYARLGELVADLLLAGVEPAAP